MIQSDFVPFNQEWPRPLQRVKYRWPRPLSRPETLQFATFGPLVWKTTCLDQLASVWHCLASDKPHSYSYFTCDLTWSSTTSPAWTTGDFRVRRQSRASWSYFYIYVWCLFFVPILNNKIKWWSHFLFCFWNELVFLDEDKHVVFSCFCAEFI